MTLPHATAWLFHRNNGFSTAYVGPSNLPQSPRLDGLEWNIRQGFRVGDASDRLARAGPDLACASRLPLVASADEDVGLFGAVNLVDVDPGLAPR